MLTLISFVDASNKHTRPITVLAVASRGSCEVVCASSFPRYPRPQACIQCAGRKSSLVETPAAMADSQEHFPLPTKSLCGGGLLAAPQGLCMSYSTGRSPDRSLRKVSELLGKSLIVWPRAWNG